MKLKYRSILFLALAFSLPAAALAAEETPEQESESRQEAPKDHPRGRKEGGHHGDGHGHIIQRLRSKCATDLGFASAGTDLKGMSNYTAEQRSQLVACAKEAHAKFRDDIKTCMDAARASLQEAGQEQTAEAGTAKLAKVKECIQQATQAQNIPDFVPHEHKGGERKPASDQSAL